MRKQNGPRAMAGNIALIGLVIIALALLASLFAFYRSRSLLPANVYVGDVNVGGLTVDAAMARITGTLNEPVVLRHQTRVSPMLPRAIDYAINENVARLGLNDLIARQQGIARFPAWLASRNEIPSTVRLPAPFNYSESKLAGFVANLAGEIDQGAKAPTPGVPGQDGLQLAQRDAADLIVKALGNGTQRIIDLPVDVVPADPQRLNSIAAAVNPAIDTFAKSASGNVAGVYIKDLRTGEEFSSNADVAFSAGGWQRLLALVDLARNAPVEGQTLNIARDAVLKGDDAALANALRSAGNGDAVAGLNQLNGTAKKLGLTDTYFAAIPGQRSDPVAVVTAANSRSEQLGMRVQRDAQSTPANIGMLLEFLEQCRLGGGPLALALGPQFNKDRCEGMLNVLGANDANALIAAGTGELLTLRRQSWDANTHADAALVRAPTGSYVIVVALYSPLQLPWNQTSATIKAISAGTYTYFNAGRVAPEKPPVPLPPAP